MNQIKRPKNEKYVILCDSYENNILLILKEELEERVDRKRKKNSPVLGNRISWTTEPRVKGT